MEEKQSRIPKFKRSPEGRDPRFPMRVLLIWAVILIAVPVFLQLKKLQQEPITEMTYGDLEKKDQARQVTSATAYATTGALDTIKGEYLDPDSHESVKFAAKVKYSDGILNFFKDHNIPLEYKEASQFWYNILISALPCVL